LEALAVIWAPASTLARVAEERRVLLGFGVVALYAALGLIGGAIAVFGGLTQAQFETGEAQPLPPGLEDLLAYVGVFSLVSAVIQPFVLWLLVSGLMQLVTRFFGGTGPFSAMLAVVGVAQVPLVISAAIYLPITGLQIVLGPADQSETSVATVLGLLSGLLGLAFLLWHVALVVIGAAFARRVGYGESAGSCAISCAGCIGLILIVVLVFVVLVAVIVGAAGLGGSPS
jgi:hypothetical protein